MLKVFVQSAAIAAFIFCSVSANAADLNVRVVNLTDGNWLTPLLVPAHLDGTSLFSTGQPASASLQAMAEGGDIVGLMAYLTGLGATDVWPYP